MDEEFWSSETVWFYVSLLLGAVLIFQAGMWYQASRSTPSQAPVRAQGNQPTPSQPRAPDSANNPTTNQPTGSLASVPDWIETVRTSSREKSLGNPQAPVKVVEYLDLECPFCQKFNRNAFPKILENYVKTGKVYYRVRHYPLGMHERAIPAGNAVECAADQGKFWAFKYVVMNSEVSLTTENFLRIGDHIGVPDMGTYETCVKNQQNKEIVLEEQQKGSNQGVRATPTVFVEDQKIEGAQSFGKYRKAIDRKLDQ